MNIFISHSSSEAHIATDLCNVIEGNGHKCFIAPRDIRLGFQYAEELANGIDNSEAVLLVLSAASNNSPHVLREIERAVTRSIPILVYKVEDVQISKSMEYFLMTHQWMEAGKHTYQDVVRCIDGLKNGVAYSMAPVDTEPKKKSNKTALVLIASLAAVISTVALMITTLVLVNSGNSDNNPNDSTTLSSDNVADRDTTDKDDDLGNNDSDEDESSSTNETETDEASDDKTDAVVADVKLGDTIVMGSYNDEDIYWRVIRISDDGTEAVLVARDVLTVKAYDAPDSGKYNHDGETNYYFSGTDIGTNMELQAYVRGNSSWANSNIRTWLNSEAENVKYEGQAPTSSAMADGANGYNNEKGFLCNFTEDELSAIKTTVVTTKGNELSTTDTVETEDKVFLLSKDELKWLEEANVSLLAEPTAGAIERNDTYWYKDYSLDYGLKTIMWWLREPVSGSSCQCYLIGNGYSEPNIFTWEVGVESFGIRPAMTIDLTSEHINVQ